MSDVMFYGILRMPLEMAMQGEVSRYQFWQRAQEAADRVERLEAELGDLPEAQNDMLKEIKRLKADIERHVDIASQQEAKLAALEKQEPVAYTWMFSNGDLLETPMGTLREIERECIGYDGEPVPLYLSAGGKS